MSEPKWPMVLRPNPLSMGVPVKPTSAALGSAWAILAQQPVLGPVGLVHHDDDVVREIQQV